MSKCRPLLDAVRALAIGPCDSNGLQCGDFNLAGTGDLSDGQTTTSSALVEQVDGDDVLKITQVAGSQLGEAYAPLPGLLSTDGIIVRYQMYTGDGSGADGQCVNIGANTLGAVSYTHLTLPTILLV